MEQYGLIERDLLTSIADTIRVKCGTSSPMTPAEMCEAIEALDMSQTPELPAAEEYVFGKQYVTVEYAVTQWSSTSYSTSSKSAGWSFVAAESFQITQLQVFSKFFSGSLAIGIWNSNGDLLFEANVSRSAGDKWYSAQLEKPLVVTLGETYTVGCLGGKSVNCHGDSSHSKVISSKLRDITYVQGDTGTCPTTPFNYFVPMSFRMEPVEQELPYDYQVGRPTLDDIATEVMRITDRGTKMSLADILSSLQAVPPLSSLTLHSKTVTPSEEVQVITPDSGYYGLSQVTVEAVEVLENAEGVKFG